MQQSVEQKRRRRLYVWTVFAVLLVLIILLLLYLRWWLRFGAQTGDTFSRAQQGGVGDSVQYSQSLTPEEIEALVAQYVAQHVDQYHQDAEIREIISSELEMYSQQEVVRSQEIIRELLVESSEVKESLTEVLTETLVADPTVIPEFLAYENLIEHGHINQTGSESLLTRGTLDGLYLPLSSSIADLSDVDTSGIAVDKVLKWNGTAWVMGDDLDTDTDTDTNTTYTAGSGLSLSGTQFLLGGTLSESRSIDLDGYNFIFTDLGSVAVGPTSPTAMLDIAGASSAKASLRIRSGTAPTSPNPGDVYSDGGSLYFYNGTSWLDISTPGSGSWSTSGSDVYYLAGNVGVGTSSPGYPLDVTGSARVTGSLFAPGLQAGTDNSVLVLNASGEVVLDEIDARVWGTSLLDVSDIGTSVQAYDDDLAAIASLIPGDGYFIVGDGSNWVAESGATVRTSLGLGTGDYPTFAGLTLTSLSDGVVKVSSGILSGGNTISLASEVAGILPLGSGGTSKALTASEGSVVYSDADSFEMSTVGTSGYLLASGGTGAPTWVDPTTLSGSGWWSNTANALVPKNEYASVVDLLLGGDSTSSAQVRLASDGTAFFTGNVGVGSTSPGYGLDVTGTARFGGEVKLDTLPVGSTAVVLSVNGSTGVIEQRDTTNWDLDASNDLTTSTSWSGDLSGTGSSPVVSQINGVPLGTTTAGAGNILVGDGSQWVTRPLDGDANLDGTGTLTLTTSGVVAGTYGSDTLIPVVTVDAKGRVTNISTSAASYDNYLYWTVEDDDADTNQITRLETLHLLGGPGISTNISATDQLTITNTGVLSLTGTTNQVSVSASTGAITISLEQDIATTSSPTFAGLTLTGLADGLVRSTSGVLSGGANVDVSSEVIGVLALVNGGTGKNITASAGSIIYSDADSFETSSVGSAGYLLASGGTGAPIWVDPTTLSGSGWWANNQNAMYVKNEYAGVVDLLVGGEASSSAGFRVTGLGNGTTNLSGYVFGRRFLDVDSTNYYVEPGNTTTAGVFAGNLGIGSTSPIVALDVDGSGAFTGGLSIGSVPSSTSSAALVWNSSTGALEQRDTTGWDTDASNDLTTSTSWSGDLSGTGSSPVVSQINGVPLGTTTAGAGNILVGDGSQWVTRPLDGDASLDGTGTLTLTTSGVVAGTYGSDILIPVVTVDAKGRITTITTQSISADDYQFWTISDDDSDTDNLTSQDTLQVLGGAGISTNLTAEDELTITNTGVLSLTGTANQVSVSAGTGDVTISLEQDIATSSSPTFNGLTLSGLSDGIVRVSSGVLSGGGTVNLGTEVTGVLALANGGTGKNITASAGSIIYSDADSFETTSVGSSGYLLASGGSGAPTWVDPTTLSGSGWWSNNLNALVPKNEYASVVDLVLGGSSTASANIRFGSSGTGYFAGNVGIGTTTPDYQLQVNGTIAPETTDQDLGTTALRWDVYANTINADSALTFTGVATGTDNTVLLLNSSNEVVQDEIDPKVWGTDLVDASSGTTNYLTKWTTGGETLGDSVVYDDGTNVGVGTTTVPAKMTVAGTTLSNGFEIRDPDGAMSDYNLFNFDSDASGLLIQANSSGAPGTQKRAITLSARQSGSINVQNSPGTFANVTTLNVVPVSSFQATTGSYGRIAYFGGTFAPTSGAVQWEGVSVAPTINQTGGASGVSRGLYVNPTLTAAADFRGIELANTSGYGVYQSGVSVVNYFGGNVGVGTTSPDYALQVNGTIAPEVTDQDLGTTSLRWDIYANTINADNTLTFTGIAAGTDNTVLILNSSNEVIQDEIDARVWGTTLVDSGGGGVLNYVARFTDSNSVTIGTLYDTGTNVGIGTDTPSSRLDIYNTGSADTTVEIQGTDSGYAAGVSVQSGAGANWKILTQETYLDNALLFGTGAPYQMVLNTEGNLGIGSTSPTEKIDVGGTVRATTFTDGTASLTTGDLTGVVDLTASGVITFSGLSDGLVRATSGVLSGGNSVDLVTETTGILPLSKGGTAQSITASAGSIIYSDADSFETSSVGNAGYLLASGGTGAPTWLDPATLSGSGWWTAPDNALYPKNEYAEVVDLLVGGSSTASADFRVTGAGNGSSNLAGYTYARRFIDIDSTGYYVEPGNITTSALFAGNVGIGTTTPDYKLQVDGTIAPETTDQDLGTGSLRWDLLANTINADSTVTLTGLTGGTDNTVLILDATNQVATDEIDPKVWGTGLVDASSGTTNYLTKWTVGGETLGNSVVFDDGTNVGIGTTTPDYKLQVDGTIAPETTDQDLGTSSLRWDVFANTINADNTVTLTGVAASTDNTVLLLNASNQVVQDEIDPKVWGTNLVDAGSGTTNYLTKWSSGGETLGDSVVYDNGTNIGIGTTTVPRLLTVNGAMRLNTTTTPSTPAAGDIYSDGTNVYYYNGATWDDLTQASAIETWWTEGAKVIYPKEEYAEVADLVVGGSSTASADFRVTGLGNGSTDLAGYTYSRRFIDIDSSSYYVEPGNTTTAALFAGNVGIGTTSPDYQLQVNGTIAPEITDQDLGTASLRWDIFANTINADSTLTFTGVAASTDNTVLLLNSSNQVIQDEIDPRVWGTTLVDASGGIANYVARFSDGDSITTGELYDNGTNVGVGTTNPSVKLDVVGNVELQNYLYFGNATAEYIQWDGSNFIVSDDVLPATTNAQDLGSTAAEWRNAYLSGTLDFGTNTITDGTASGNWNFSAGSLSNITNLSAAGTITFSGLSDGIVKATSGVLSGGNSVNLATEVSGILALANGGTAKNITASAGSIVYSDADSFELSGVGNSGYLLASGGTGAPTWVDPTTLAGSVTWWGNTNNALHPVNEYAAVADVIVGGSSTASASIRLASSGLATFAGNVGIGTTTPDFELQVNGTIAPETTDQDLGTTSLRWDIFANTINADSTLTFTGVSSSTDNTVLLLNSSNQVVRDEIDPKVWTTNLVDASSGTTNYLTKWSTGGETLANSQIYDNGTNVGIGTTVPSTRIQSVATTNGWEQFRIDNLSTGTSAAAAIAMGNSTGGALSLGKLGASTTAWTGYGSAADTFIYSSSTGGGDLNVINSFATGDINFYAGSSATGSMDMIIQADGNIGVGTSSPGSELDIASTQPNIRLHHTETGLNDFGKVYSSLEFYSDDPDHASLPGVQAYIQAEHTRAGTGHTFADAGLTFGTLSNAGSVTERMRIQHDGNVGIGTTLPSAALEVSGNSTGQAMELFNTNAAGSGLYTWINNSSSSTNILSLNNSTGTAFIVKGDGNVGIGTTTTSRLLTVNGAMRLNTTSTPGTPASGDIYSDGSNVYFYNGSTWDDLTSTSSIWSQSGSDIYYTAGNVSIGTSTAISGFTLFGQDFTMIGNNKDFDFYEFGSNAGDKGDMDFYRARGSYGAESIVQNGDQLGSIRFSAYDGFGYHYIAQIRAEIDGTPGNNDLPTRLEFYTTSDNSNGFERRWHIDSAGDFIAHQYDDSSGAKADVHFIKGRGSSSAPTAAINGDEIGTLRFTPYDGSNWNVGAQIKAVVDGTLGTNDIPTRIDFLTVPDGSSSLSNRMTIANSGNIGIATTNPTSQLTLADGGIEIYDDNYGIGFFNESPYGPDASTGLDAGRMYFDNSLLVAGTTSDFLVIEKTDGNTSAPDGGVAFLATGSDDIQSVSFAIRGDGDLYAPNLANAAGTAMYYNTSNGRISYSSSSERYKQNIGELEQVNWIYELNPVEFEYKSEPGITYMGLIAEQVEQVNPKLVFYKNNQVEGVHYDRLATPLLLATQQHQMRLTALENSLEKNAIAFSETGTLALTEAAQGVYSVTFTDPVTSEVTPVQGRLGAVQGFVADLTSGVSKSTELVVSRVASISDLSVNSLKVSGTSIQDMIRSIARQEAQQEIAQQVLVGEDQLVAATASAVTQEELATTLDTYVTQDEMISQVGRNDFFANMTWTADVLTVMKQLVVKAAAIFEGPVTFLREVTFRGEIRVNQDTAGSVTVPAGVTKLRVSFEQPFSKVPVVYITNQESPDIRYGAEQVSTTDFVLTLSGPHITPVRLNWLALVRDSDAGIQTEILETQEYVSGTESSSSTTVTEPSQAPLPEASTEPTVEPTQDTSGTVAGEATESGTLLGDILLENPQATDSAQSN